MHEQLVVDRTTQDVIARMWARAFSPKFACENLRNHAHLAFLNCWVTNVLPVTSYFPEELVHFYGTHSFDPRILEFTHLFKKPRSTIAKGEHDLTMRAASAHQLIRSSQGKVVVTYT